jgi:hypothetical protein
MISLVDVDGEPRVRITIVEDVAKHVLEYSTGAICPQQIFPVAYVFNKGLFGSLG